MGSRREPDQVTSSSPLRARSTEGTNGFHVALESNGEIQVFDVWDSQEEFDAFGETLLPRSLRDAGVELKEPMVARVHNVIR